MLHFICIIRLGVFRRMIQPVISTQSYNKHLCDALDKALSSLGEAPKEAVYYQMEESYGVMKWEIPMKMGTVEKFLEDVFGSSAILLKQMFHTNLKAAIGDVCIVVPLSQFLPTLAEYKRQHKTLTQQSKNQ